MNTNLFDIEEIKANYAFKGDYCDFSTLNQGHINNTYLLRFDFDGAEKAYILQQINTAVFKDPDGLMDNYVNVTEFIRDKVIQAGGNPMRESIKVYKTKDGKPYYLDGNGRYWRVISYVIDTVSYDIPDCAELCFKAGKTFGNFQKLLADYPAETLVETIPNFHNTVSRYANFEAAAKDDKAGRAALVQKEIEFAVNRKNDCSVLLDLLAKGELPVRVTHNDTKLNNVLFDKATGEGICVVDLDTVMPGLSLYDFGDSLRFAGNTADEDEKDLSKVKFNMDFYRSYTEGYLSAAGDSLTETEVYYLPFSCKLMTLECGMRFLTDYLNGDVYFRIGYPEHNLDRCRTQFKLVEEMESLYDEMLEITQSIYKKIK